MGALPYPIKALLSLFFSHSCAVCGQTLVEGEDQLCTSCIYNLPRTHFHKHTGNPVEELFWGRVRVERAASFYQFFKGSSYQHLIHLLKYQGKKEIGSRLGELYGAELKPSGFLQGVNAIVPVPLHPVKQAQRGYNQSEWIARGLSLSTGIPQRTDLVRRKTHTATQTRKSKEDRWKNMQNVFQLNTHTQTGHMHALLVDDVVTTGATLEAVATVLLKGVEKVSIVTLAKA